jgi:hypothetical protein
MLLHHPPRLYCVGECSSKVLTGGDIDVLPSSSVGVVAKVAPAVDTHTRAHTAASRCSSLTTELLTCCQHQYVLSVDGQATTPVAPAVPQVTLSCANECASS